ncbi:MAG: helix-turn-helix transcriptional regulator [Candidatus Omnitrophota bacterium]|nr:helix-turn-helix transcriptional regulator [Candidatus Omnitrophota bacterium]
MLSVGKTVYLWRSKRGLTQEQLARATGIPRPNLSNLERGKQELSLKTLRLLASVLKVTPGTLVDGISPLAVKGPLEFSRKELDHIANAAFGDEKLGGRQAEVVELLKILASNRISRSLCSGKRRVNAAWLQFKSALSRETVNALIQRIEDREITRGR